MNEDISPKSWGPHGWKFLHYISLSYPMDPTLKQKEQYRDFFISVKNVLPCELCAKHYEENIKKIPLTSEIMNDKNKLIKWVIDIHNLVNEARNKPIVKYEDAIKMIKTDSVCRYKEKFTNNNVKSEDTNFFYMLILILCGLILVAMVYKKK